VADGVDDGYPQPIGLTTTELELAWRDVALAAMGYASGDQLSAYVNDLRAEYSADTAYVGFITRWPVGWIGYAGFPRVVMHHDLGNWGPTNMDRVFAHETGHIFGAPDEYASSNCSCSTKAGRFFSVANANCANCDDGGTPCLMNVNSFEFCAFTPLHFGWGAFMDRVDAAMWRGSNDKVYLFGGNYYLRYTDVADGRDSGYPAPIAGNWKDIPLSYWDGFDAALWRESNGKIYFFNGDSYIRIDGGTSTMDPGYPLPIAGNWPGLPEEFNEGIDAAFWRESNNKIYLFKGSEYVRLNTETLVVDAGYPKPIAGNWQGVPASFTSGIDAALMRRDNHKIYFFKGAQYVRIDGETSVMDTGYPAWIDKNWMPFPR
jgi:hypothetical protein